MGKFPAIFVAILAIWLAWSLVQNGPEKSFGGLFGLLDEPQYGEADRPTRSGHFADRVLQEGEQRSSAAARDPARR